MIGFGLSLSIHIYPSGKDRLDIWCIDLALNFLMFALMIILNALLGLDYLCVSPLSASFVLSLLEMLCALEVVGNDVHLLILIHDPGFLSLCSFSLPNFLITQTMTDDVWCIDLALDFLMFALSKPNALTWTEFVVKYLCVSPLFASFVDKSFICTSEQYRMLAMLFIS
jgi:hypothetical protein